MGRVPGAFLVWNRDFYGYYFIDLLVVHKYQGIMVEITIHIILKI